MRIVGGTLRGRAIRVPSGADVRPTSDRARESLFNILLNGRHAVHMDGAKVLDVYAGTGALGLEALSRGAAHAVFVDNNRQSIECIRQNAESFQVSQNVSILRGDAQALGSPPPILSTGADVTFLDPPYKRGLIVPGLECLLSQGWVSGSGLIVAETESGLRIPPVAGLEMLDSRKYGAARISFLRRV